MRRLILIPLLLLAVQAGAATVKHDCRIGRIRLVGSMTAERDLRVRAIYIGHDGQRLTPMLCPDQTPPTFGWDDPSLAGIWGDNPYEILILQPAPGVYRFEASTAQPWFDRSGDAGKYGQAWIRVR